MTWWKWNSLLASWNKQFSFSSYRLLFANIFPSIKWLDPLYIVRIPVFITHKPEITNSNTSESISTYFILNNSLQVHVVKVPLLLVSNKTLWRLELRHVRVVQLNSRSHCIPDSQYLSFSATLLLISSLWVWHEASQIHSLNLHWASLVGGGISDSKANVERGTGSHMIQDLLPTTLIEQLSSHTVSACVNLSTI